METESTKLVVTCRCGQSMGVSSDAIGRHCKCVKCAERFEITHENTRPYGQGQSGQPARHEAPAKTGGAQGEIPDNLPGGQRAVRILSRAGLITGDQGRAALAMADQSGGKTIQTLIDLGFLTSEGLYEYLAKQPELAAGAFDIKSYQVPREVLSLVPRAFAEEHLLIPTEKIAKVLTAAMVFPLDTLALAEVQQVTGLKVRPVLSSHADVLAAIEFYYASAPPKPGPPPARDVRIEVQPGTAEETQAAAQDLPPLNRNQVIAALEQIETLPALPGTIHRIKGLVSGPNRSIRDMAGIVSTDPSVAGKLLSVANATPYGLPGQVTNVNLASTLLGFEGTNEIVMSFEQVNPVDELVHFDFKRFWLRSMFCAAAAMSIAKMSNHGQVADAYTVGVLHEIGRLALASVFPKYYAQIPKTAHVAAQIEAEQSLFGLNHSEAGYVIARLWRLPKIIAEPIRLHHDFDRPAEAKDLTAVAVLASTMTEAFDGHSPIPDNPLGDSGPVLQYLGIPKEAAQQLLQKTSATLRAAEDRRR